MIQKICPNCFGVKASTRSGKEVCGFCNSELAFMVFLEPLENFLANLNIEKMRKKRKKQIELIKNTSFWSSKGRRKRFYLKDFLKGIESVISLYEEKYDGFYRP